ncbi:MAG: superinfection immunity protein [Streptosporangiales bacterium]|nr:superinfection immunity protein [Streptosporangiales bacterium]
MEQTFFGIVGIIILLAMVASYGLPSIIALLRKAPSAGSVIVINIFLGWTFVGWVVALAMAVRSHPQQVVMAPPTWGPGRPGALPPPGGARPWPGGQLPAQERRGELNPPSQEGNG